MESNPKSFGEFSAAVLSAMDTSAYVPASVAVGLGWFIIEVGKAGGSLSRAVEHLGETKAGGAVVAIAAVFVLAAILQPFQFGLIRVVEGYVVPWPFSRILRALQRGRRLLLDGTTTFCERREEVWSRRYDELLADSREDRWRWRVRRRWAQNRQAAWASAGERRGEASRLLPEPTRTLPLPLGNRLRSFEDAETARLQGAGSADSKVEDLVPAVYDQLPHGLRFRHDHVKGRLEAYCTLIPIFLLLGVLAQFVIDADRARWSLLIGLGIAALVSHAAAMATAVDYGEILRRIVDWHLASLAPTAAPTPAGLVTESGTRSRWARLFDSLHHPAAAGTGGR